jgi:predicted nucleic acid-binding protein
VLRVIADTNVYVSALHVGGVADEVLAGARAGQFQLFISRPISQELARALVGKLTEAQIIVTGDRLLHALGSFRGITVVSPRQFLDALAPERPQG